MEILLEVEDRLRMMEQGEGKMGEQRLRPEAKGGSCFGGEGPLWPTLCKQVGPRKPWMHCCCNVRFHTYSLLFLVIPTLLLKLS